MTGCAHGPTAITNYPEGSWCDRCGRYVWPPVIRRGTTTQRAWAGDLDAPAEFEKYEEGIGEYAKPREIIGE